MSDECSDSNDCEEAIEKLYGYLDRELTTDTIAELKQHLDDCSPCLDMFDFEAELRKAVASKCHDTCPDQLRSKIESLLTQAAAQPDAR